MSGLTPSDWGYIIIGVMIIALGGFIYWIIDKDAPDDWIDYDDMG